MKDLLSFVALALSLTLAAPADAASKEPQKAASTGEKKAPRAQAMKPAPTRKAALSEAVPVRLTVEQVTVEQAAPSAPAGTVPVVDVPAVTSNPYLAGWFRPTEVSALPALFVNQMNSNAQYVVQSVAAIPEKLTSALPSFKTVHPTGGRDLLVANVKCPAEMVTGQYLLPTNLLREGVNGLLEKLNESRLLAFDIQLVCS